MTLKKSYIKAKQMSDKKVLDKCLDLNDVWVFSFRQSLFCEDPIIFGGGYWYVVDKTTGVVTIKSSTPEFIVFLNTGSHVSGTQLQSCISSIELVFYNIFNR